MSAPRHRTVSVLGLGRMGAALAAALLAAGHRLTVWNRTPGKTAPLVAKGAVAAATAAEAVAASQVAILCVLDHAAATSVLATIPAMPGASRCLVMLTTLSADQSVEAAQWADAHGLAYLEGSIMSLPALVAEGRGLVAVAGSDAAMDAVEDVLEAFGPCHRVAATAGSVASFDRVYFAYTYGTLLSFLTGAALAHAQGFSVEAYTGIVVARVEAMKSILGMLGANIATRDHSVAQCSADIWEAGIAGTPELCRKLGVDDALPAAVAGLFRRNAAAGRGGQELSAIFETLLEGAGR